MVIDTVAEATVRLRFSVTLCAGDDESVTSTLKAVVPTAVGVPDSTPADDRVSPAGRVEPGASDHV